LAFPIRSIAGFIGFRYNTVWNFEQSRSVSRKFMLLSRARVILFSGFFLFSPCVIWAQTTSPAPMATTQPAPADSPRGALKALVNAMQAGDAPKIKSLIATTNPTEQKMVDAMATMSVAQKKFRDAAQAAYGTNAKELTGDTEAGTAEGLAKIDAAPESIKGDTATVDPTGQPGVPPLTLKKVDGQWRIPISELARGVDQNTIQQRLEDLGFMSQMMNESADEVAKGMYKTPKDAGEAIKSKMMKRANAATQSSTQPTAPPPMNAPATAPSTPGL
jgi:hypothetical protein